MKGKPKNWFSEFHEQSMHPTVTVHEQEIDRPKLILPDGTELVAKKPIGFRPK